MKYGNTCNDEVICDYLIKCEKSKYLFAFKKNNNIFANNIASPKRERVC